MDSNIVNDINNNEIFNLIKSNKFDELYKLIKNGKIGNLDIRDNNLMEVLILLIVDKILDK